MKKWNRLVTVLLVMAMLFVSLAGCGKKAEKEETQNDAVTEKETETEVEVAEAEEAEEPEVEEEPVIVDTRTPVQKWWGGDWYGIMWITGANGNYSDWDNQYWDAMGTIDVDESGAADMKLWYEAQNRDTPVAEVKLTISEDSGSGEMGAAISESGWMFVNSDTGNGDIDHAEWIIDPMTDPVGSKYGNDMIHIEGDFLDGSGEIYYHFFFRKWGTLWDDVAKDPEMLTPGLYEDWYKPLVEAGYAMPENIGDEGSVLMADQEIPGVSVSKTGDGADEKSTDNSAEDDSAKTSTPSGGAKYTGGDLVLADDENCKIVIKGMGAHPYNESWIGYLVELTNKTDASLYFTSYAEPNLQEQTMDSLGTGNTCIFKGEVTKTHFGETINAGATYDKACIVIDGVTDAAELGNVQGYISVVNNETGEVLNNIPYEF